MDYWIGLEAQLRKAERHLEFRSDNPNGCSRLPALWLEQQKATPSLRMNTKLLMKRAYEKHL
jgi:hypothetical protein